MGIACEFIRHKMGILEDSNPPKWVYRLQTETKHKILKEYIGAWFPILGSWNDRLVVIDGFAGRASYTLHNATRQGDAPIDGSPLIMLKTLLEHNQFKNGEKPQTPSEIV